jgi:hypothetical protein
MAYDHWTECVKPDKYSGPFLGSTAMVLGIFAAILAGIFDPGAVPLTLILTAIGYCRWWLYGRLVCLGGDQCIIGLALGVYNQSTQDILGKFDTDYGVNILPAPSQMGDQISAVVATNAVQGHLLGDQGATTTTPSNPSQAQIAAMYAQHDNLGFAGEPESYDDLTGTVGVDAGQGVLSAAQATALGIDPKPARWQPGFVYVNGDKVLDSNGGVQFCVSAQPGLTASSEPDWPKFTLPPGQHTTDNQVTWEAGGTPGVGTMEVEFEGAGVWDLYVALLILTPFAVAAAIPGVGLFLFLLLLLIGLIIGAAVALTANATPAQDDPSIGDIHPGKDVLFVMGRWIYDTAHEGWNELHPVLLCQKVGDQIEAADVVAGDPWANRPELADPMQLQDLLGRWCALAKDGQRPDTKQEQQKPQNGWGVHPTVDGCDPGGDPPRGGEGGLTHLG